MPRSLGCGDKEKGEVVAASKSNKQRPRRAAEAATGLPQIPSMGYLRLRGEVPVAEETGQRPKVVEDARTRKSAPRYALRSGGRGAPCIADPGIVPASVAAIKHTALSRNE